MSYDIEQNKLEIDFDSYIRQAEPSKQENGKLWKTAIGLQQVDGLTPSKYLYETARRNIEGEITIEEAKYLIDSYYESKDSKTDDRCEEADKVSVRIREILAEKTFSFTPALLLSIHKRLFTGVFKNVNAGKYRDYNITKREWVLDGETVFYADADMISQTLEYDFSQERDFDYSKIDIDEQIKHIARFIANIWQIHPFGEGNTRTTAVFTIKYLNSLGFNINNDPFEKNSWYIRNSLVRANYTNVKKGIQMNTIFLERFFRNVLLGEEYELKNRYIHLRAESLFVCEQPLTTNSENVPINAENVPINVPTNQESVPINDENVPINVPINQDNVFINETQKELLDLILKNPNITYEELAAKLQKTRETVRRSLRALEEKKLIKRVGANKNGHWEILR